MIENDKVKLTTFIIGSVIFIAFIKQYIYYDYFSMDISNYIGLDEVLTPFIDELAYNVIVIVISIGMSLHSKYDDEKHRLDNPVREPRSELNLIGRIIRFIVWNFAKIMCVSLIITYIVELCYTYDEFELAIYIVFLFSMFLAIEWALRADFLSETVKKYKQSMFTIHVLISLLFFSQLKGVYDIFRKKHTEFKHFKYEFVLSNKKIITNQFLIYLGRTEDNFFILNRKQEAVEVYKTSDIKTEKITRIDELPKQISKAYGISSIMLLDTKMKLKALLVPFDKIYTDTEHQCQIDEILNKWKIKYQVEKAPFNGIVFVVKK